MVSVRDLDWKKDGSLGYFIVFGRGLRRMNQLRNFCGFGERRGEGLILFSFPFRAWRGVQCTERDDYT
jgi:hypothetical protein